jgi:hypothetical protein
MLREQDLCRTPNEELLHRFEHAKKVDIPNHDFAANVDKMLRCLLQSSEATKHMKLIFVDKEHLHIAAGFFGSTWSIHNRWLTHQGAHESTFCEEESTNSSFRCDHAVLQLWDIMLPQLIATGEHPGISANEAWLMSLARTRLL